MEQDRAQPERTSDGDHASDDSASDDSASDDTASDDSASDGGGAVPNRLWKAIGVFTLLRVGLMAVLTAALMIVMPLIVALAFAIVLQLPLAFLLFPAQRRELTAALAERRAGHHAERDRLRAQLMGQDENSEG